MGKINFKRGLLCTGLALGFITAGVASAQAAEMPNLAAKEIVIKRGMTEEAAKCIECHAKKDPWYCRRLEKRQDGPCVHHLL